MKHLVISVSHDSSLELLAKYADVILLDTDYTFDPSRHYETVYIRSHFGQADTLPQVFRNETEDIVQAVKKTNPTIRFIDSTDTVDKILAIEDKWTQYTQFRTVMPRTSLLSDMQTEPAFIRPVFKNRFSSRGNGVTWDSAKVTGPKSNWIVQESLDIKEELRIYILRGTIYPVAAIRQSKSNNQSTLAVDSRSLEKDEIIFSEGVAQLSPEMDIVGIDVARTHDGKLFLLEANRSPGFKKFYELTQTNLADILYADS